MRAEACREWVVRSPVAAGAVFSRSTARTFQRESVRHGTTTAYVRCRRKGSSGGGLWLCSRSRRMVRLVETVSHVPLCHCAPKACACCVARNYARDVREISENPVGCVRSCGKLAGVGYVRRRANTRRAKENTKVERWGKRVRGRRGRCRCARTEWRQRIRLRTSEAASGRRGRERERARRARRETRRCVYASSVEDIAVNRRATFTVLH